MLGSTARLARWSLAAVIAMTLAAGAAQAQGNDNNWVAMVNGGGKNVNGSITEWITLRVTKNAAGEVSGMYEYANEGLQNWRYKGTPDCLAISVDGARAVAIGPVTNPQGPEAPKLGTRVAFLIEGDNETGGARAYFSGTITCEQMLQRWRADLPAVKGNYTIRRR